MTLDKEFLRKAESLVRIEHEEHVSTVTQAQIELGSALEQMANINAGMRLAVFFSDAPSAQEEKMVAMENMKRLSAHINSLMVTIEICQRWTGNQATYLYQQERRRGGE